MASDALLGTRLKLERALQGVRSLEGDIATFGKSNPFRASPEYYTKTRVIRLIADIVPPCPGEWGVRVGEIVHNLRSALDHLVWQLVIHNTGKLPMDNKTQFPIFKEEAKYRESEPRCLRDVGPDGVALIKEMQPFAASTPGTHPLWRLHELSNFDKHRTLQTTIASLEAANFTFSGFAPHVRFRKLVQPPGPLKQGVEILRIHFPGSDSPFAGSPHQVKVRGPVRIDIAFDEGCAAASGALVVPLLDGIGSSVREVVKRLATEALRVPL